jgi:hypothetical protein
MKTAFRLGVLTCLAVSCVCFVSEGVGAPFVPIQWQQRVKSGALENQRKHVAWSRDLNRNFVDDDLDAMEPEAKTTVIVQMNACLSQEEITRLLGQFGSIRRIGTLVPYVILDNVRAGDAPHIATNSAVAAVGEDRVGVVFNDTATRTVRARTSLTYSPETFADKTPSNGAGIDIAVLDTGVDDSAHAAFGGKFVMGYNAITSTSGNPVDDYLSPWIGLGPNGICNTTAAGDDVQFVPNGNGESRIICIRPGPNGVLDTVPAGDDYVGALPRCDGNTPVIAVGPNWVCNTTASGDDVQVVPVGQGLSSYAAILPGNNGTIDSTAGGDDILFPGGVWHGTHVAGIAMGLGVGPGCRPADDGSVPNDCAGMAPGASLVEVKVANSTGHYLTSDLLEGLEWVWQNSNARVINLSLGNDSPSAGDDPDSQLINTLVMNGITVVVSSGNSGQNLLGTVASAELAVTVAASDDRGTVDRDDDQIASFSTFGPRSDFTGANVLVGQLKPDITAPGVSIMSAQGGGSGGYHALSGTSMSSPCVAGAAALLLSYNGNIPPGSLKELLKRSAYVTPQHTACGVSYPAVDGTYNVRWGFGLLDLYQAHYNLQNGIADVTFPSCLPGVAGDNCTPSGNCNLSGGQPSWLNTADILTASSVVQGVPNTLTVRVENRTAALAEHVVVTVGVRPLGVGSSQTFYSVGSKTIDLAASAPATLVNFDWTPSANDHQCVIAKIDYGFDKDFCNNQTQRNFFDIPSHSMATATFQIENPFNETATIMLTLQGTNDSIRAFLQPTNVTLRVRDCPVLGQAAFIPPSGLPIGARATFFVRARGYTASHPEGVELPGVAFNVVKVAGGLERAYLVGRHGDQGLINLPLNLAGAPTSDPRAKVDQLLAVFDVPVRPTNGVLTADQVIITGSPSNAVPPYTVFFAEGGNVGKELTIMFSSPLQDQQRYRVDFTRFVGEDGAPLLGDLDVEFRVLQGDANNSGAVTATDVSFVRGRINKLADYGDPARADVNMTGAVTATDVSFVRSRIGHSAPSPTSRSARQERSAEAELE